MEIAYALAVFGVDYDLNKRHLLDLWESCLASPDRTAIEGVCNDTRLSLMLANLYFRGDETILPSLLIAADSKAYAAEELGHFYAEMLDKSTDKILGSMAGLPAATQRAMCRNAMYLNLDLDPPMRNRVTSQLRDSMRPNGVTCLDAMTEAK
jgi:hypothetical protein